MNKFVQSGILMRMAALIFLGMMFFGAQAQAQTTATTGEKQVGVTTCANGNNGADFDTIAQCNSITSSNGTFQKAPLFVGTMTSPPYAATTCTSSNYGMIQYTGTDFEACTTAGWITFAGGGTANAFSFTNQTGVNTSATISSNAVTLTGFNGTLSATCGTGCTAIARNGVWGGTTVSGFQTGDTIAIQQTSSASANTATTATVTVGTTTSSAWSVTTNSSTPSSFSFTNQTGVSGGTVIASGDVTLSGFTGTLTATCGTGCTQIAVNSGSGDVWGGTTATGIASGSSINIRLTSSTTAGGTATATVTVGSTTSSTWTVTTAADPCASVTTIGSACPNGEVYAGISPDSGTKMYVTPCDYGASGSKGSCGTSSSLPWSSTSYNYATTGYTSTTTGKANTAGLAALNSTTDSPYRAAAYCYNLTSNTYTTGWYLPSLSEFQTILSNAAAIGGIDTTSGNAYWTSTESNSSTADVVKGSTGSVINAPKTNYEVFRCARRL